MDIVGSLNGSVNSQGVKVEHRAWLDMGSPEWKEISDTEKAAAYQAARVCGWTDEGLKAVIIKEFEPRIDHFMADVTIETLQELAKLHPLEVEEVYQVNNHTVLKKDGKEITL